MISKTTLLYLSIATTATAIGACVILKPASFSQFGSQFSIFKCLGQRSRCSKSSVSALKSPEEWVSFEVIGNSKVTHNSHLVTMKLPLGTTRLGLTMNSCLLARMKTATGDYHVKPYTPISSEDEISKSGTFSLLVKKYPNGTLSRHICELKQGDMLDMKGPIAKINLEQRSPNGTIASLEGVSRLAMIAGGTGITPMLQAAEHILKSTPEKNSPKISLISANDSSEDILASEQLENLVNLYPNRIEVHHVLRNNEGMKSATSGLVTCTVLEKLCVVPAETQKVFVCGPLPMMTAVCGSKAKNMDQGPLEGVLSELGFTSDQVYKF
ncbi:hypothetical protein MDAP_001267 [Mitosporidium daphniae]|uniref:NADH-cytochrome b5 reductase n=1 Tax=Mitosporidium daphniae TaxID=1485682 RepID=A0A098VSH0_9MICR|nr:uncharacterized protein DI09_242p10 [Mitosporidium daphniae]KGG51922.1 hypothetical protein DI09_242p10 [Mitosporidium daphniae]|eukprot:XP_013238358.1 uncharacterized protein DI09_242p10 [Mitosporidium daphniae]